MTEGSLDELVTLPLSAIRETAGALASRIVRTPSVDCLAPAITRRLASGTRLNMKLELFQHSGSFKARSVLAVILSLTPERRARGVAAVSAGNHAIATAWAARSLGVNARLVMFKTADPARIALVRSLGGEVVIAEDVAAAFDEAARLQAEEGRYLIHPFAGRFTSLGAATVATEWLEDVKDLDAVVISIGGGGLIGGVAAAIKQIKPSCLVFGVEPEGADSMARSLAAGAPVRLDHVETIADSLGAPYTLPYSFGLCARYVDDVVLVPDAAMIEGMRLYLDGFKLMCEPAGAATLAATLGPLRDRLQGARVGVLVCGSTIELSSFLRLIRS
ncbi:threonine dehydratase [Arboricoccus pini]|uniref:Threonine dehydratase n=1 Tax=Arboricoccus pini TaxID=1963835 RepID=A0A212RDV0_9PROT|nr:pyridoxal-phosphate dependent enzyme [Arboricoccus pini]SNB70388.1 threonine dehydratase [Arboricoccus pini]